MCGIFGLVSRYNSGFFKDHVALLQDMAICGQLRGVHGSGFFSVSKEGKQDWVKIGDNAQRLLNTKEYDTFIENTFRTGLACVGHNRFATKGDHSTPNAHPFKHKHIMLVHNGMVTNTDLDKNKVKVDSHSFTKDIANEGDAWKDVLTNATGAFCFVWHDHKLNKLLIYRNHERPMSMYRSDAMYIFASEKGMAHWLGARRGMKMDSIEIKPEVLYSFDMNLESGNRGRELMEEPLPLKKGYSVYSNYSHYERAHNDDYNSRPGWKNGIYTPPAISFTPGGTVAKKQLHNKKVGETILFSLYDETSEGLGASHIWKYTGILEEDGVTDNIDIYFLTKNRAKEWMDMPLLAGTICSVHADGVIQVKSKTVVEVESETVVSQKQIGRAHV